MDISALAAYVKQALILVLMLSLPTVLTVGLVGLTIAFLQAVTQIQDSSISFGIKLVIGTVVLAITSSWLGGELYTFVDGLFFAIQSQ